MYKLSELSQSRILETFKGNHEFSEEEKEKIYGAYEYLKESNVGEKYIENIFY